MASLFIACGTYDGSVLCYEYNSMKKEDEEEVAFKLRFVDPEAHGSSVKTVAFTNRILLSGSTDEYIKLFSLNRKSKLGMLDLHTGTVKKLATNGDSRHFLSCSTDCTIALWRCKPNGQDFECVRHLMRHKGDVDGISLHPSGKIALSISQDKTLRVWDLMHGRQAYVSRVKSCGNDIIFNPDGSRYVILYNSHIDVFHLTKSHVECSIQLNGNLGAFEFIESDCCAVIVDKVLTIYRIGKKVSILYESDLTSNKIKDLRYITCQFESQSFGILVTVKTDAGGSVISGYRVNLPINTSSFNIAEDNKLFGHSQPHIRVTCLSVCFTDPSVVEHSKDEIATDENNELSSFNVESHGESSESNSSTDDDSSNEELDDFNSEDSKSEGGDSSDESIGEPAAKKNKTSNN